MLSRRFIQAWIGLVVIAGLLVGAGATRAVGTTDEPKPQKVVFHVWGEAPRGVKVAYGGKYEHFDGNADTPFRATLTLRPNVHYYDIYAWPRRGKAMVQLKCSIRIGDKIRFGRVSGRANETGTICEAAIWAR